MSGTVEPRRTALRFFKLVGPLATLSVCVCSLGCSGRSPQYPTSERPPERPETESYFPPPMPERVPLGTSLDQKKHAIDRFLIALSLGDERAAREVLSPGAVLKRSSANSSSPTSTALSALITLFTSPSPASPSPAAGTPGPTGLYGGRRFLSFEQSPSGRSVVLVEVLGSEAVAGTWKFTMQADDEPTIVEVLLPSSRS